MVDMSLASDDTVEDANTVLGRAVENVLDCKRVHHAGAEIQGNFRTDRDALGCHVLGYGNDRGILKRLRAANAVASAWLNC